MHKKPEKEKQVRPTRISMLIREKFDINQFDLCKPILIMAHHKKKSVLAPFIVRKGSIAFSLKGENVIFVCNIEFDSENNRSLRRLQPLLHFRIF